jgi:two-component system phosphate regulon sensor histidine kinase PhoR
VLLLDAGDQIEWCNSVAAEHFGLDPQRDRRQRVTNLVRSPAFVAYLQNDHFDEAVSFPDPRGKGLLSVLIRRYGEGMKLVISQDITERERAEAMRRDFVANVSHEIRTPLTVLSGFIETMTNLKLSEIENKRVLQLMTQQAERMQALVSDLLTLAQLEGSPRPTAERWVPLDPLLTRIESDAKALSAGRHSFVVVKHTGAQLAGAEPELLSAITNLVNNAVRYTPTGGRVEVAWRLMADGAAELSVNDTGPGIAREHLSRLTERFYRVDGSRSRDTGGTGLGLSIVKHVVQRHGGELQIHSEVGKGSSFRLVFPALRVRVGAAVDGTVVAEVRNAATFH